MFTSLQDSEFQGYEYSAEILPAHTTQCSQMPMSCMQYKANPSSRRTVCGWVKGTEHTMKCPHCISQGLVHNLSRVSHPLLCTVQSLLHSSRCPVLLWKIPTLTHPAKLLALLKTTGCTLRFAPGCHPAEGLTPSLSTTSDLFRGNPSRINAL